MELRCNGFPDCDEGEDESNCESSEGDEASPFEEDDFASGKEAFSKPKLYLKKPSLFQDQVVTAMP